MLRKFRLRCEDALGLRNGAGSVYKQYGKGTQLGVLSHGSNYGLCVGTLPSVLCTQRSNMLSECSPQLLDHS